MMMAYQLDARKHIRDQSLAGESVILSEGECAGFVESSLRDGTLKLAQSKGAAIISLSTFTSCDVIAVKRQRDFDFFSARFISCKFEGTYSGISFGREGRGEPLYDFGSVEHCDFTEAILDGCRFVNVDASTLKFPGFPHVIVLDPHTRAGEVAGLEWPGHLGRYMEICTNKPESVKASVLHIPSLARLVQCTEEEIKAAFEKFGGLQM